MNEKLFNLYLNLLTDKSRNELRISQELADKGKYHDAHDHQIAASTLHDAILLGNQLLVTTPEH